MKILEANAGVLTNFEVLDFLKSRGAGTDSSRAIAAVAPIQLAVYDYLEKSAASKLTKDNVIEFVEKFKKFNLAKAEILNIINLCPSLLVEIALILEERERGLGDDENAEFRQQLLEVVAQVLPAPPSEPEPDDDGNNEEEPAGQEKQSE